MFNPARRPSRRPLRSTTLLPEGTSGPPLGAILVAVVHALSLAYGQRPQSGEVAPIPGNKSGDGRRCPDTRQHRVIKAEFGLDAPAADVARWIVDQVRERY